MSKEEKEKTAIIGHLEHNDDWNCTWQNSWNGSKAPPGALSVFVINQGGWERLMRPTPEAGK